MMDSRFVKIALCVGMLQIAGYYLSGSIADADSMMSAAQPDTLLYCQAARRIAEGHPFSFSHGEPVSTGTTSVLYPFVLSVPYAFGAKGDALLLAGFVLNALFYLLFLAGWTRVFCDLFESSILRFASILLLALSPQPAYCALAQSDIGLWMALSGLFASAFFSKKTVVYAVLLALGPWIRPEGMVLLLVFCAYAAWSRRKRDIVAALAGVASACGVFVFNHILTGKAQFSSVANKGYFITLGFPEAVYHTVSDMVRISKEFVFGMSELPPRMFFLISLLGTFFVICGIFSHVWRGERAWKLGVFIIAGLGGLAMVAMSGWQNTNLDRYLAWSVPLVVLFLAEGAVAVGHKIADANVRRFLVFLPSAYAACASLVMFFVYAGSCRNVALLCKFGRACESIMPEGASIGGSSCCGVAYEFTDRRFAHLPGIYSPEFQARNLLSAIEVLKNEPNTRFDYWLLKPETGFGSEYMTISSDSVAVGPVGWELRKTKWNAFDNASAIPECGQDKRFVARVDVGYEKEEEAAAYRVENRYEYAPFDPVLKTGTSADGGKPMVEVARMIAGFDEMTVPLECSKDARVVMRTFSSCDVVSKGVFDRASVKYQVDNPARLNLSVNGVIVGEVSYSCSTNGISDVAFDIPGSAITTTPCSIAFLGDHITCGYWFYQ